MLLFIGTPELIVVFLVILLIFGPEKIPEIARNLGRGIRMLRDATHNVKNEIMKESDEAWQEGKKLGEGIKKEFEELGKLTRVDDSLDDLGDKLKSFKGPVKRQ
ncbi:MAG: twin-arginine translocase TatA/TatE family subunit [Chlorobi bacterium]|nr:twin-arginine translocase TatA/TatE family subunit [Chlorobiota bacterium]